MSENPADDALLRQATGEDDQPTRSDYLDAVRLLKQHHENIESIVNTLDDVTSAMITCDEALLARLQALEAVVNAILHRAINEEETHSADTEGAHGPA